MQGCDDLRKEGNHGGGEEEGENGGGWQTIVGN